MDPKNDLRKFYKKFPDELESHIKILNKLIYTLENVAEGSLSDEFYENAKNFLDFLKKDKPK